MPQVANPHSKAWLSVGAFLNHDTIFYLSHIHRIIECFGLEGTFKGHLAQTLCSEQGHLQLDQVAQSPVQLALNVSRDGASTMSLGNLCQGFTTLVVKNLFFISSLNLPPLV